MDKGVYRRAREKYLAYRRLVYLGRNDLSLSLQKDVASHVARECHTQGRLNTTNGVEFILPRPGIEHKPSRQKSTHVAF